MKETFAAVIDNWINLPIMPFRSYASIDSQGIKRHLQMPLFSLEIVLRKAAFLSAGAQNPANNKAALTEGERSVKLPVCLGRVLVVCKAIQYNLESMFEN